MPNVYHEQIISLKRSYHDMWWFQKLFFPYQLAFELENYSVQHESNAAQLAVFKAFETSTWFFHKWFFAALKQFSNLDITKNLLVINFAGLLTGDSAQANFDDLVAHQDPYRVACALSHLHATGLLTGEAAQANRQAIVAHLNPRGVATALRILHATGLLTGEAAQANFNAVVAHQNPWDVAYALCALFDADLLTGEAAQANFDAVCITHSAILLHLNNDQNHANLWNIIPDGLPTAAQFQAMIQIAQTHAANPDAGSLELINYVINHILGEHPQQNPQQPSEGSHALDNTQLTLPTTSFALTLNRHALFQAQADSASAEQATSAFNPTI